MRQYQPGYDHFLALLPILDGQDETALEVTDTVMVSLGKRLMKDKPEWIGRTLEKFERSILAVEEPSSNSEGVEVLVAHWPTGFKSPVHGHAGGYLYEQVLSGEVLVETYRHVGNRVVRPVRSENFKAGDVLVSDYIAPDNSQERIGYVHSFTALTPVDTLHFLPEHTRDSRDNAVRIEHYAAEGEAFTRLDIGHAVHATKPGDVALVRSSKVGNLGDHWVIITGDKVKKPHGWRPEDTHFAAAKELGAVLDAYQPDDYGMIFLKLNDPKKFYEFHGITVEGGKVLFPKT
jgi:hypothetical protein